ncbi:DUF4129 domain-containing protein [Sinomicrobium weinanense]|uniref:DUF4129 domain-containing protein n=1 Tax=Sinomicrobium weinanense TaxID=2842200 RepID=A0A926JS94_9FLAO|nr:DUF4129 domain-containing protein [Sinomicrobium weinanense]MBC9796575.1 DUF4129 domain-containing protein [Sinomicrobium weinanense]MBU3123559.1 DUF4129 domain-containing protein [Sinomicrobium weinanense]
MKKYLLFYILCLSLYQVSFSRETVDSLRIDTTPVEKREFSPGFSEKYNGPEYQYETNPPSGWFTRFKEWLARLLSDLFRLDSAQKAADITDISLKIFYILLIMAVIFFIVRAIMNREGQWIFRKSSDRKIITARDIENNIHITDFNQLVSDAVSDKNYREAIRYYYLWLLKELSGKELIAYDTEKTNTDYLRELKNHTLQPEFGYASYLYNYIWYGKFDIDQAQYSNAARTFSDLINSLAR